MLTPKRQMSQEERFEKIAEDYTSLRRFFMLAADVKEHINEALNVTLADEDDYIDSAQTVVDDLDSCADLYDSDWWVEESERVEAKKALEWVQA